MAYDLSLDGYIYRLAHKIAAIYPHSYADVEDYVQEGYLTLAEINNKKDCKNFRAYAIISIANAIRNAALDTMCAVYAPRPIKRKANYIKILLANGETDKDICIKLNIDRKTLFILQSLINTKSWNMIFDEPIEALEPFLVLEDILSSENLTDDDKELIQALFENRVRNFDMTRKQKYSRVVKIRSKLTRSGYDE